MSSNAISQLVFIFQISESTDPKIRGLLGSLPSVFMALGISYTYLLGTFLPWHYLAFACCIDPIISFIGVSFVPESPVWLRLNGRIEEWERASAWLNAENLP